MKLTLAVKLAPSPEQAASLLRTMRAFNAACDFIADRAFAERSANKIKLQKLVYADVRARFGLSAQMAIRAIAKVGEAYKRDRKIRPAFRPLGAVAYDQRILSWKGVDRVSLLTLDGREVMPFVMGGYQRERWQNVRGQADLVYRDGRFFLYVVVEVGEADPFEPNGWLGADLGIVNIASDSDGGNHAGGHLNGLRARHDRLRCKLQKKGTKSACRRLKRRRLKETRFAADVNHRISKQLVTAAHDTGRGIALEDLEGIRDRVTVRKRQRRKLHSWAFHQLGTFISYKAKLAGVPVVFVDPRDTSRQCPCCGTVNKANRPERDRFVCVSCGFAGPADSIAARNIASRAAVMRPHAGPVPPVLASPVF
jgi:IS605 OrfB family transposase